jgi:crotonobetainyl-CoA:carnitine CoA-transferase CaiB-like acyl-CoA transferase
MATLPPLDAATFEGLRVLDLTRLLPGPFCTQLLADLGADVLKVEPVGEGDYARWYPPMVEEGPGGWGRLFDIVNRGKRSLALDVRQARGLALLEGLIARSDVLVEGFRPGVLERWGLTAERLHALQPGLIVCRISGFGQDGPDAHRAGHDLGYVARAGLLGLAGPDPVLPLPMQVGDLAGGTLWAAFAIAAALWRRERTGQGATLDIAMVEGAAALFGPAAVGHFVGPGPGEGMLYGTLPCYRTYRLGCGSLVAVAALEPKFWSQVCHAVGHPAWATRGMDPTLAPDLAAVFAGWDRAAFEAAFGGRDACVEWCRTWPEVLEDAHLKARGAVVADRGQVMPDWLARAAASRGRAPFLGEHTRPVLAETLGLEAAAIDALLADGVVACP